MNYIRTALLAAILLISVVELQACAFLQSVQTTSNPGPVNCSYQMQFDIFVDGNISSMDYIVTDDDGFIVESGCATSLPIGNSTRTINFEDDCGKEFEVSWIGRNSTDCNGGSCAGGILNIDLISFSAEKAGEKVELHWEAIHDEQFDRFVVERSANGTEYQTVGEVLAGPGTNGTIVNYSFLDEQPASGLNYYRLAMINTDGSVEFSEMRSVQFSGLKQLSLWPNPAGNILHLDTAGFNGSELAIYDQTGNLRKEIRFNGDAGRSHALSVDVSNLDPGIYLIGTKGHFRRFVKH